MSDLVLEELRAIRRVLEAQHSAPDTVVPDAPAVRWKSTTSIEGDDQEKRFLRGKHLYWCYTGCVDSTGPTWEGLSPYRRESWTDAAENFADYLKAESEPLEETERERNGRLLYEASSAKADAVPWETLITSEKKYYYNAAERFLAAVQRGEKDA